jgi:hypothetical protein
MYESISQYNVRGSRVETEGYLEQGIALEAVALRNFLLFFWRERRTPLLQDQFWRSSCETHKK